MNYTNTLKNDLIIIKGILLKEYLRLNPNGNYVKTENVYKKITCVNNMLTKKM